ncbi:MAG: cellulase N-terminal Ig-like domain-containing protein, partial [Opitutaceae bacterium]
MKWSFARLASSILVLALPLVGAVGTVTATDEASSFALPFAGNVDLRIVSPAILELVSISAPEPRVVPPPPPIAKNDYRVVVDDRPAEIANIGWKRRTLYAPLKQRDLRVATSIYLELAEPLSGDTVQTVKITLPANPLWPDNRTLSATSEPLRYSPALHVNQEGYVPSLPKIAMTGYYLGSLGELHVQEPEFEIVDVGSGKSVFRGRLQPRRDAGYTYSPKPYQSVREADFTALKTPGEYRLAVRGLGTSLPFRIADGELMNAVRAYALGLYHQRC